MVVENLELQPHLLSSPLLDRFTLKPRFPPLQSGAEVTQKLFAVCYYFTQYSNSIYFNFAFITFFSLRMERINNFCFSFFGVN
jgi:hypothetical protein